MSRRRRNRKNQLSNIESDQIRQQIAEKTLRVLVILTSVLIAVLLILVFRVGESMYPVWVIEHRNPVIGVLLSITTVIVLVSPVIVEVNSNPRPLTGPGHRPSGYF